MKNGPLEEDTLIPVQTIIDEGTVIKCCCFFLLCEFCRFLSSGIDSDESSEDEVLDEKEWWRDDKVFSSNNIVLTCL